MKHTLLLTSAAVALTLGLTPALAQDHTDSKMKRDPAANGQNHRDTNTQPQMATPDRGAKQNAENKARSGTRSTTGQASGENSDKTKAADTDLNKSGADAVKGAANEKNSSQPKKAEDQSRKPASNAADNKSGTTAPSKNAEQNDSRSPAAQKSTQRNEPNRNASSNARSNDTNRNAKTNDPNRNTAESKNASEPKTRISASLDPQKKSRLTTAFDTIDVKPVAHVNFAVSVGTVVPRDIDLRPVPRTIVEIVPQYRDYDFFVVRDEIVIVQPRTHKIVDVIERGPTHARAETTTRHVKLSRHQREIIHRHARSRRTVTTGTAPRTTTEVTVGQTLPDSVEVESFPEEVYREVPEVREYRYIERGDDVYLVDPSSRRVIEEVR